MTREQAIEVLISRYNSGVIRSRTNDDEWRLATDTAIVALRGPWVKTADRLPTEADAGVDEEIVTIYDDGETRVMGTDYWAYVAKVPERFPYWLPVPKLPEVEG